MDASLSLVANSDEAESRRQNGLHDSVAWEYMRHVMMEDLQKKQLTAEEQNWTPIISEMPGSSVFDERDVEGEIVSSSLNREE